MELMTSKRTAARKQRGMSLVELMIAMVVLLVGLMGSMSLVAISMGNNNRSRLQGNSTIIAQMITEKVSSVKATTSPVLTVPDCAGNILNITTAAGGSPLNAQGDVDFTQAPVAGYQVIYTDCGSNGRQFTYDVRWNIQQPTTYVKVLTVTAQKANINVGNAYDLKYVSFPVTIRTLIGQGT